MKTEIRFPPKPLEDEPAHEWEYRLRRWRMEEKRRLFAERGPMCERGCGARAEDLDESILTRGDMRGLSIWQRRLAFCNINLELACAKCNRESAQDREGAFARACKRDGERNVRDWYFSLGLKAPRHDWL